MNFRELADYARYRERTHMLEYKFFPGSFWCACYVDWSMWAVRFTYGRPRTVKELINWCFMLEGYEPSKVWGRFKAYLETYERIKKRESIDNPGYTFKAGYV